jgi:hypothetical protein
LPYQVIDDTLVYTARNLVTKYISDSLVIKKFGDYIVLNERVEHQSYWSTHLIKVLASGDLELRIVGNFKPIDKTESTSKYDGDLKDFSLITNFQKLEEDTYLINPSKKEFKKLVDKGFFRKGEGELTRLGK